MHVTRMKIEKSCQVCASLLAKNFKPACYTLTLQLFPVFKMCMTMLV